MDIADTCENASEADSSALSETLYLLGITGMRESIIQGLANPLDQCADEPGW